MVCFILQSPPHIDREPVSFITLGSCPPFQSQHTTDLLLFVDGEQIGPGRVVVAVVVVVVGGNPRHRVAHIPPQTVREVSPFKALKQQNTLSAKNRSDLTKILLVSL